MNVRLVTTAVMLALLAASMSSAGEVSAQSLPAGAPAVSRPSSAPAGPMYVAIIEPEVLGDLSAEIRKGLTGAIDTLVAESLAKQKGFVLVDRQALDKVLQEKALAAGGISKVAPEQVGAEIRPFWSAGVLICPSLHAETLKTQPKSVYVSVEAVAAQNGQLLSEVLVPLAKVSAAGLQEALQGQLDELLKQASYELHARTGQPLVEVSGQMAGKATRLQWIVEDMADAARGRISVTRGLSVLRPRQPFNTKEERLLRVMGLAAAKTGDAASSLSATPDARLTFELVDSEKAGVALEQTPIELNLTLSTRGGVQKTEHLKGTVGQWETARSDALKWLSAQLTKFADENATSTAPDPSTDHDLGAKQARAELASVSQWTSVRWMDQIDLPGHVRRAILERALRASHLDPTNEMAQYLIGLHVGSLYAYDPVMRRCPDVCYDREIAECARYLERFGRRVPEHHLAMHVQHGRAASDAAHDGSKLDPTVFPVPDATKFHYIRIYVRSSAEWWCLGQQDKSYRGGNGLQTFSYSLVYWLIPYCPQSELAAEYEYWKTFWAEHNVDKFQSVQLPPWAFAEATFAARQKDPQRVRAALQELARIFPSSFKPIWGGNSRKNPIVPEYLKEAGDPDWATWMPTFPAESTAIVSAAELNALLQSLRPAFPDAAEPAEVLPLPAKALMVPGEAKGNATGPSSLPARAVLATQGDVWLQLPKRASDDKRPLDTLFVAKLPQDNKLVLRPECVPWPEPRDDSTPQATPCEVLSAFSDSKGNRVWLGTNRGLACFGRSGEGWKGRWYGQKEGLPFAGVTRIIPVQYDGVGALLLNGTVILDPASGQIRLLVESAKDQPAGLLKMRDGRLILPALIPSGIYGQLDLRDVTGVAAKDFEDRCAAIVSSAGQPSFWAHKWNVSQRTSQLEEHEVKTAAPTGRKAFEFEKIGVFPYDATRMFLVDVPSGMDPISGLGQTPYFSVVHMVGIGDTLWMVTGDFTSGDAKQFIWGYRPGAKASQATSQGTSRDLWIGPFAIPDGTPVTQFESASGGRLLLTTWRGSFLADSAEMMRVATKASRVVDSDSMKATLSRRMETASWQAKVPAMVIGKQWDAALAAIQKRQEELAGKSANEEVLRLRLWRAHVLAVKPGALDEAITEYKSVADVSANQRPARLFARVNEVYLLHKNGRFREVLDVVDLLSREFPQIDVKSSNRPINAYIEDARRKLAASQPATRPSGPSAQAAVAPAHQTLKEAQ